MVRAISIFIVLMVSQGAQAQLWEALADGTQLFTASCTGTAGPVEPPESQQTEAGIYGECADCAVRTDPAAGLLQHSRLIAADTFLSALARERSLNHECALGQLGKVLDSGFEAHAGDVQAKVETLSHAMLDYLRAYTAAEKGSTPAQVSALREKKAAVNAIEGSIPFSSHPVMKDFIAKYVRGALKDSSSLIGLHGQQPIPPKFGETFRAQLKSTLQQVKTDLEKDRKNLEAGVASLGVSLDRATRESLAQDRDLIEAFFHNNPALKPLMKTTACRVDKTFGAGAEARDQALLMGSVGLGVAGGGLGLTARGIGLLTGSARIASARGLLSANSARIFGALAVNTGRTALAVGTAAGFRETASACLNSQQVVPEPGKGNRCEKYSIKGIVADNCYLAAGLTTLGTVANVPAVQRLIARLLGKAATPASRAEDLLGRKLTPEQEAAVQRAHEVGLGAKGRDGGPAGIGNYTDAQLREKAGILKQAGFSEAERRRLVEAGIVGLRAGELPPGFKSPYVAFEATNGKRYAGRFIGADDAGYILETGDGARQRISPSQLGVFKESTTARLAWEPVDDARVRSFRDIYLSRDFSGANGYLSVQTGRRLPARHVGSDDRGTPMFEILDPDTGKREVRILTNEELLSARQSDSARETFARSPPPATPGPKGAAPTRVIQEHFGDQAGYTADDALIGMLVSRRSFVDRNGEKVAFNTSTPASARESAIREGRLLEIRASEPRRLPEGSYTYVITRDGQLVVGRVEDSFEFGVKHSSLARGREVVSAGEIRVRSDGSFAFNNESGTFVRPLVEDRGVSVDRLQARTLTSLQRYLSGQGNYSDKILIPRTAPSRERLQSLCVEAAFCAVNASPCRQVFGPQVCN